MGRRSAPIEVAQGWVEALEESDFDEVMRFYAPRATLHLPGKALCGRVRVREYLQAKRIGPFLLVEIQNNDRVHIPWHRGRLGPIETAMGVAEGQIAEQWLIGPEPRVISRRCPVPGKGER
jgi:hypothetical protein